MKSIIFYCNTHGKAALITALIHLGMISRNTTTVKELLQLTWWRRVAQLPPGQLLEIGCDQQGNRVFILWVDRDKQLLPKLAVSFSEALNKETDWQFVDALPQKNGWINTARFLSAIAGHNYLTHRLFLQGFTKLPATAPI